MSVSGNLPLYLDIYRNVLYMQRSDLLLHLSCPVLCGDTRLTEVGVLEPEFKCPFFHFLLFTVAIKCNHTINLTRTCTELITSAVLKRLFFSPKRPNKTSWLASDVWWQTHADVTRRLSQLHVLWQRTTPALISNVGHTVACDRSFCWSQR